MCHGTSKQYYALLCRPKWTPHRTELLNDITVALASSPPATQQAPLDSAPSAAPAASNGAEVWLHYVLAQALCLLCVWCNLLTQGYEGLQCSLLDI